MNCYNCSFCDLRLPRKNQKKRIRSSGRPRVEFYNDPLTLNPYAQLRSASRLGRLRVLARQFASDVCAMWRYGAPFPTFLKIIGTLIMCLLVLLPILYPTFVAVVTYFTFEGLFLSWWLEQPWRFTPRHIGQRALSMVFHPSCSRDSWKVREVLTRGILLLHSLATSVDYLCVMQGLLDEA